MTSDPFAFKYRIVTMATETNQDNDGDTVVSILKDIRDLLRHQEERITRLEHDQTPKLPENWLNITKAEKGKQVDGQPPSIEQLGDTGALNSQPPEDQTNMKLPLSSQHLDEVASTSSSGLSEHQSNSDLQESMITPGDPPASEVRKCRFLLVYIAG
jgi:hypothetical protein